MIKNIDWWVLSFRFKKNRFDLFQYAIFSNFLKIKKVFEKLWSFKYEKLIELKLISFGLLMVLTVIFPEIDIEEDFSSDMLREMLIEVLKELDKDFD